MVGQRADCKAPGGLREPKHRHRDAQNAGPGYRQHQPQDAQPDGHAQQPLLAGDLHFGQASGPPKNDDHRCRACGDPAAQPHVKVRPIDREQHVAEVQHGMKQRHGKHAAAGVVEEPDHQDPNRHGVEAPPGDPCRRPVHDQQRHQVPCDGHGAQDQRRLQRAPAPLQWVKRKAGPAQLLAERADKKGSEQQQYRQDPKIRQHLGDGHRSGG